MARQGLPFDILLLILEISPLPTASKMARTCHTLHEGGTRFLLAGGVSLITGDSIISFAQFMYADALNRFQHLRTLELACGKIPPPAVDALQRLISHSSLALDSLTLQDADAMLKSTLALAPSSPAAEVLEFYGGQVDPLPLIDAIAELTTIRHLAVRGHCGPHACKLIKVIRSPLRAVSMEFARLGRGLRVDDLLRRNLIFTLASHSATLEEISGSHFAMLPGEGVFDAIYPAVHTITATFSYILPPRTLPFIAAFPNLTRLSLTPPGVEVPNRLERALERRRWQRELQENHLPRQAWANLEELEGSLPDILALGLLECQVSTLRLTGTLSETLEYEHVKTALEDARPAGLAIAVVGSRVSAFGDMMGPVLGDPSARQLRTMEVELVFSPSETDVDIQTVLNDIATTLAVLPLHRVALTLNYGMLVAREGSYRPQHAGCSCPMERDAEGLDVVATQALFRAAIPSLVADVVMRVSTDRAS